MRFYADIAYIQRRPWWARKPRLYIVGVAIASYRGESKVPHSYIVAYDLSLKVSPADYRNNKAVMDMQPPIDSKMWATRSSIVQDMEWLLTKNEELEFVTNGDPNVITLLADLVADAHKMRGRDLPARQVSYHSIGQRALSIAQMLPDSHFNLTDPLTGEVSKMCSFYERPKEGYSLADKLFMIRSHTDMPQKTKLFKCVSESMRNIRDKSVAMDIIVNEYRQTLEDAVYAKINATNNIHGFGADYAQESATEG